MTGARRRWLIVGPGIVLAAILATQITMQQRRSTHQPPIIEHQVIGGDTASTDPVMEIGFILDRADRLHLSAKQIRTVQRLKAKYESEAAPIESDLDREAKAFGLFMSENSEKTSVAEVQRRGAMVSELSREASTLRRIYWERALNILDAEQAVWVRREVKILERGPTATQGGDS